MGRLFATKALSSSIEPSFLRTSFDNNMFVDKSGFLVETLKSNHGVIVLNRPNDFGKTVNLDMLHTFLSKSGGSSPFESLFCSLAAFESCDENDQRMLISAMGQRPVIRLSLATLVQPPEGDKKVEVDKTDTLENLRGIVHDMFKPHEYLLKSSMLSNAAKKHYVDKYFLQNSNKLTLSDLERSVLYLCDALRMHHRERPYVLIDDYDTPLLHARNSKHEGWVLDIVLSVLRVTLKDNGNLGRGILTGVGTIHQGDLWSYVNNVAVFSENSAEFSQWFGFTESEISALLERNGFTGEALQVALAEIREQERRDGCIVGGDQCMYTSRYSTNSVTKYLLSAQQSGF